MADNQVEFNTVWYQGVKGNGKIQSGESLKTSIAIPELKGGSGDGTDPFRMLVSSTIACYVMTLTFMLHQNKLPVSGLYMNTEASETKENGIVITHYPHLILMEEANEDQIKTAQKLVDEAEKKCHIGNFVKQAGAQISVAGKVSLLSDVDEVSDYVDKHGLDW
ncbi:OsmC family protein [Paenibacillus terrae]|uniref:OsmC family protein n=1 Tax=Paenibacillus terrae TaxID=159743 RepID=UPI00165684DF|nr:OsmC family protein [Paenibacillus terrae]